MQLDHQLIIDLICEAVQIDPGTAEITTTPHGTPDDVQAQLNELAQRAKTKSYLCDEWLTGTWDDVGGLAQALAGICQTNLSAEATATMAGPIIHTIDRASRALIIEAEMDPHERPVPF
jgi:hypothetical protein